MCSHSHNVRLTCKTSTVAVTQEISCKHYKQEPSPARAYNTGSVIVDACGLDALHVGIYRPANP